MTENSAKMPEKAFPMTVQCSADSDKAQKKLFPSLHFYINKAQKAQRSITLRLLACIKMRTKGFMD